jgi:simple sugar transport system ATP-binding protein
METPQSLARMMIGTDFTAPSRPPFTPGPIGLELRALSQETSDPFGVTLKNIHLSVAHGEVVGIAGISGNGQLELCQAISGQMTCAQPDTVRVADQSVGRLGVLARRAAGLCYIPEDRQGAGAVPELTLAENTLLTAARSRALVAHGLIDYRKAEDFAAQCIQAFRVKAPGPHAAARSLSGGNLQKFITAREVLQSPRVLLCAQPTWGVDVGAAAFIRQSLIDLARQGCAVLVISEELDELFEVCDRIAVIAAGRLSPVRSIRETSVEELGVWMSGLWPVTAEVADAQT